MELCFKCGGLSMTTLLTILGIGVINAELYTTLVDLEELLETEDVLIRALDEYITTTEHRLTLLKRRAAEFRKVHEETSVDVRAYLSNPMNVYLLIKRLTNDWKQTESLMIDFAQEFGQNMTQYRQDLKFPTDEDLSETAEVFMRLQDTYKLDTSSLAQGLLNGVQYSTQLSADDCFELGIQSYNNRDYYHTVLWMSESLRKHDQEKNRTNIERWEILEYLAYSTYMQGNVRSALQMTDELLTIVPTHQRALGNRTFYQAAIEKADTSESVEHQNMAPNVGYFSVVEVHEMLCRNDLSPRQEILSKLRCRYVHRNEPFLRIAPLKEEEAFLEPRIVLYRDVIYDGEIEVLKKIASPRLKRAFVVNMTTGEAALSTHRISKSAWLKEEENEVVARVNRRVEHMTSLTTSTAEDLQVVNYGIGGRYLPHCDSTREIKKNASKHWKTDDRIATVLFYMSDVAQGGATVFPYLQLSLWPEKGTAVFWYNLHPSGKEDLTTLHAACPVLAGFKWASNKWLHERGQEFRRPCSLEREFSEESG